MNKVILIGNLTQKPTLSQTSFSGTPYCRMTVAVARKYANANGEKITDFLPVVAWRKVAENCCKYLDKGSKVGIVGSIQTHKYEDGGKIRTWTEIIAEEVEFLSSPKNNVKQDNSYSHEQNLYDSGQIKIFEEDDDLPF